MTVDQFKAIFERAYACKLDATVEREMRALEHAIERAEQLRSGASTPDTGEPKPPLKIYVVDR